MVVLVRFILKGIVVFGCVVWELFRWNFVYVVSLVKEGYLGIFWCWFYIDPGGEGRFDDVMGWVSGMSGGLDDLGSAIWVKFCLASAQTANMGIWLLLGICLASAQTANMGIWLLLGRLHDGWLLEYELLIRRLLDIQGAEDLKFQYCFIFVFAGTWMEDGLSVVWIGWLVVCLGKSRIMLVHFVRLVALGMRCSLGFMSRETKPL
ncbi:hypothetical protein HanRHA438_Chr11g0514451 [Helianthus annuus]|uniref:Transmembrane protein n=1 Tax=Helianthus annuus TaxID=4232 RepID=A0A9K3HR03_HELAN|nr:hypothetical protein HanXRQr2_Chr11g0501801 [Helianthus annuus]KAJ0510385.1 hypothetical protein HanIR_Chr11g0540241 [Helianthus annuus]KAJ0686304.1 hypothetical protein HanLR1_Chr11g0413261 [Helianthus annuus]KAJ0871608.1 hypothetical protein HanRHA438_Chr11g0514451 [Helianthus annuus]KAJ0876020.1 hypothetical protein HanPSC8_Chr11g0483621 [Helianthus annuus]